MSDYKVVLDGSKGTYRAVVYNDDYVQIAVITGVARSLHENKNYYNYIFSIDEPFFNQVEWKVSVPIEGMGGWGMTCKSKSEAFRVADSESSRLGRAFNRLVRLPLSYIEGTLY